MKKFMTLYMASGADFAKMMGETTPEQQKASMAEWEKWMTDNKSSFVDGGAPLGKTKRADTKGISNVKNEIGGYSIIQADSHDAAAKIAAGSPHLKMVPGTWIEVMEIMDMPGV